MTSFYTFTPSKADANLAKHGVAFEAAEGFEWDIALEKQDARFEYGEVRCTAVSFIGPRLYVMVFTRRGDKVHIISLRKANDRETRNYERF